MLESIILGMVSDNDFTGYDIKKLIENGIGVFYKASYGSLYPALKRLTVYLCGTAIHDGGQKAEVSAAVPRNRICGI